MRMTKAIKSQLQWPVVTRDLIRHPGNQPVLQCYFFTHRFVALGRSHSVRYWEFGSPGAARWQLHQWNGLKSFIAGILVSQWWFCYLWQNSWDAVSMAWYDEGCMCLCPKWMGVCENWHWILRPGDLFTRINACIPYQLHYFISNVMSHSYANYHRLNYSMGE